MEIKSYTLGDEADAVEMDPRDASKIERALVATEGALPEGTFVIMTLHLDTGASTLALHKRGEIIGHFTEIVLV